MARTGRPIQISINSGDRFGRVVLSTPLQRSGPSGKYIVGQCDCGVVKKFNIYHLIDDHTSSCGCLRHEATSRTHGCSSKTSSPTEWKTYNAWIYMKKRCYNKKCKDFRYYGGRGIIVCDRWINVFANFLADMGNPPTQGHTLERKNSDGNYDPDNCVWATRKEQGRNTSRIKLSLEKANEIRLLKAQGFKTKILRDKFGVCSNTIRRVIKGEIWNGI